MVHITEELYHGVFMPLEEYESIHVAPWPTHDYMDEEALRLGNKALVVIEEARRWKSENNLSMATTLDSIDAPEELKPFEADLLSVTRAQRINYI
jgi:valyl-tRNA synthetase